MASEIFDFLSAALGPELSATETARVRQLIDRRPSTSDVPWASGVPDIKVQRDEACAEADALREREAWLDLSFKLLCDRLAQARVVETGMLHERLCRIRNQVEAESCSSKKPCNASRARQPSL